MDTKTFEIRDNGTFIPIIATRLNSGNGQDHHLLERAGYGTSPSEQATYIILMRLEYCEAHYDPFDWGNKTIRMAHQYIIKHFDELPSGSVVNWR